MRQRWQPEGDAVEYEPLEALLVDVGGTLVDDSTWLAPEPYQAVLIARLRDAYGSDLPWFEELTAYRFPEAEGPEWQQRTADDVTTFLANLGLDLGREDVARIARACAAPLREVVQLADGALDAISAIHDLGVRMVVCSNTLWRNDDDVRRDLEELGFGDWFEAYVTSHDTGFGKPHPAIFERALAAVGTASSRAAIIGDRPERDIAGARAVGMRAIWMPPPDFADPPDPAPDATVAHWRDVPPIVDSWRHGAAGAAG